MHALRVKITQLPDPLPLDQVTSLSTVLGASQVQQTVLFTQDANLTLTFPSHTAVLQSLFAGYFQDTLKAPKSAYSFESIPEEKTCRSRSRSPVNASVSTEEAKNTQENKPTDTSTPSNPCETHPSDSSTEFKTGDNFTETDGSKWVVARKKKNDEITQLHCQSCKKLILKRSLKTHLESKTHQTHTARLTK